MKGTDFNLATSILFVGYILMQLPSNLMLTRVRPSLYLSIAMTIWGAISTAQSAVQSFSGLLVARFFLGFAEAPFFPGAVSSFFPPSRFTLRDECLDSQFTLIPDLSDVQLVYPWGDGSQNCLVLFWQLISQCVWRSYWRWCFVKLERRPRDLGVVSTIRCSGEFSSVLVC